MMGDLSKLGRKGESIKKIKKRIEKEAYKRESEYRIKT